MGNCDFLREKEKENYKIAEYSEKRKYFDVAVSRYYYYLYQSIIIYLESNFENFQVPKGENSHEYTIKFLGEQLFTLKILEYKECYRFSLLQKLRVSRRISDYEYRKIANEFNYNQVFKNNFIMVEELLKKKLIIV